MALIYKKGEKRREDVLRVSGVFKRVIIKKEKKWSDVEKYRLDKRTSNVQSYGENSNNYTYIDNPDSAT